MNNTQTSMMDVTEMFTTEFYDGHVIYVIPTWRKVLEGGIVILVTLLIIATNIFNLRVLRHVRRIAWVSRLFLLNLSVSDLLMGIIACGSAIYSSLFGTWPYGSLWCQLSAVTQGTGVTLSIWCVSMVGIDRYVATMYPLKYQRFASSRRTMAAIIALWLAALITFVAPIFTKRDFNYYQFNPANKMCGLYWEYPLFCVVTGLYIPVLSGVILVFTTAGIYKALVRQAENGDLVNENQRNSRINANKKILRLLIVTSLAFFMCWGPYVMVVYLESFGVLSRIPAWIEFTVMWLANSKSFLNVFIYSFTNRSYRQVALETIRRQMCHRGTRISDIRQTTGEMSYR